MSWAIIKAEIKRPLQVVVFDQKLSPHWVACTGIICSITDKLPDDNKINGEISLSFNSKKIHPVHLEVTSYANPIGNHNKAHALDESLIPNTLLTGYYMDKTQDDYFYPYLLQIYLKCRKS